VTPATRPPTAERLALAEGQLAAVLETPLRLLPREVRPAALRVWTCHRHLAGMESPVALAALLSVWIDEHGLAPADAATALGRMLAPDRVGLHKFASDLTADLAAEVAETLRRRAKEAEQQRQREQADRDAAAAVPLKPGHLRAMLAGIGRDPREAA